MSYVKEVDIGQGMEMVEFIDMGLNGLGIIMNNVIIQSIELWLRNHYDLDSDEVLSLLTSQSFVWNVQVMVSKWDYVRSDFGGGKVVREFTRPEKPNYIG